MNKLDYYMNLWFWTIMTACSMMMFITVATSYVRAIIETEPAGSRPLTILCLLSGASFSATLLCAIKVFRASNAPKDHGQE